MGIKSKTDLYLPEFNFQKEMNKFQNDVEIALVGEFHRCQNEALD